ncbi:ROK family transcriptional regulator [Tessaracoccus sp. MC1865]|nr:ROK family transcriptional regulator [Tessaracoccus sp. MC1865]MBB1510466.1 ROK family transcriptional regulator [Tessaracoccus sp. MC1756]QTO37463.1 ROK family transcriptional regulator [Tessaracoccus sp. MC1865]
MASEPNQSRSDLVARLGLGPATVSTQVRRLIDMGILREGAAQILGSGRPRVPLEVVPDAGRVVGVGINPGQATVATVGLDGAALEVTTVEVSTNSPRELSRALGRHVRRLVEQDAAADWWGLSVAISGVISADATRVAISVVHGWRDLGLASMLQADSGMDTFLVNDIGALAYRELFRTGAENPADFMLVSLGYGVGMAVVRDHHILSGQKGASTEIGHVSVDPLGPPCPCGNTGCLQVLVGLGDLMKSISRSTGREAASAQDLAELAAAAPRAGAIMDRAGYWLGRAVGGACTMTGLSTVLLTGQSLPLWPALQTSFQAGLGETSPTMAIPPALQVREWDASAEAIGAASLMIARRVNL